jgi:hypothetical protein
MTKKRDDDLFDFKDKYGKSYPKDEGDLPFDADEKIDKRPGSIYDTLDKLLKK